MLVLVLTLISLVIAYFVGMYLYLEDRVIISVIGVLIISAAGFGLVGFSFAAWHWIAAGYEVEIINAKYATDFSRLQIYFAGDIIEKEILNP